MFKRCTLLTSIRKSGCFVIHTPLSIFKINFLFWQHTHSALVGIISQLLQEQKRPDTLILEPETNTISSHQELYNHKPVAGSIKLCHSSPVPWGVSIVGPGGSSLKISAVPHIENYDECI